jgi:hypothetical protein
MNNQEFPLEQWFDITRKIPKADQETVANQIMLYAIKQGKSPNGKESKETLQKMKVACRAHNKKFPYANSRIRQ